jgi:hypothetical protein
MAQSLPVAAVHLVLTAPRRCRCMTLYVCCQQQCRLLYGRNMDENRLMHTSCKSKGN